MTYFEKYIQLKDKYSNESCGHLLSNYLHIVQVMQIEERNYKKHRNELVLWLNNIEKAIKEQRKGNEL